MKKPVLIIIGGFAGAGKTTIARRLSEEFSYPVFSTDAINDALRPVLHEDFKTVSPIAYHVTWHLVRKQLDAGMTIILDTHMAFPRTWESVDKLKQDVPNLKVVPIILQATLDTHRVRIEERGRTNKEHLNLGGDEVQDTLFKYDFIEKLERPDLIRVDANGSPNDVYKVVITILKQHHI
jgi:predicted kinase